jgi:hypothetical protein
MMSEMEKKIKEELLAKLMSEMDDFSMAKLGKPKVGVVEVSEKELPMSDIKDMMKEKMLDEGSESDKEIEAEKKDPSLESAEYDSSKEEPEEEEYLGESNLMQRLRALKQAKK